MGYCNYMAFPEVLGKTSTIRKNQRLLSELNCRLSLSASLGRTALSMDLLFVLYRSLLNLLKKNDVGCLKLMCFVDRWMHSDAGRVRSHAR